MEINRTWAMPNKNTFDIQPIKIFVEKYLSRSKISIDPFARDKRWATHTNDLNPNTKAEYHLDVLDFLKVLQENEVRADLVIFDPPYSLRQIKECYEGIGLDLTQKDTQRLAGWAPEKTLMDSTLPVGGTVLSFGWNTVGMGINRCYSIEEILLVCHGGGHNDTICMAEVKVAEQLKLF